MKIKTKLITKVLFLILLSATAIAQANKEIIVAIIDTGIDTEHPFLKNHLWSNAIEKSNSKDNDGNGYAGDLHGWNFVDNNADISDSHGHGTHVAGIILQKSSSINIKFMILKYYDPKKSGAANLLNTVKAIRYAIRMNANIINYSGGGNSPSSMEEAAIREAQEKGIVFVAAAGNEGRNTDLWGFYPAGYHLNNIISVAAIDDHQKLLSNSNYGVHSVDLAAPGKNIFSALPGGKFGFMTGTSMATAWVSGLVAAVMDKATQTMTPRDIKNFLTKLSTKDQALSTKIRTQARIADLKLATNVNPRD